MTRHLLIAFMLLLAFSLAAGGCGGGSKKTPDGDASDGDVPDGDVPDGDEPDGDGPDGDGPDGDGPDGDKPDGDTDGDIDEGPDPDIDLGIFWLEHAENELGNQAFKRAFDRNPNDPNARFGYALSESLVGFDMLLLVGQAIEGQINKGKDITTKAAKDDNFADWLDKEFKRALELIGGHFARSVELYAPLKEQGGVSLRFTHLPVTFGVYEATWLSGEIDDADVFLFDGMARTLSLFFDFLTAHHIRSDLYGVMSAIKEQVQGDSNLQTIMGIVVYLLRFDEAFLGLREEGPAMIAHSREMLLGALEDAVQAARAAEEELASDSDQSDEVFSVISKLGGVKTLALNVWRVDKVSGEPVKNTMEIVNPDVLAAAAALRTHIQEGGDPVPFDPTVAQVLSSMLCLPIGFGLLDWLGLDVKELVGLDYDLVTPGVIKSLLTGLLKLNVVAIHLHDYYKAPLPLRDMLPAWTTDQGELENRLYLEWECPDELEDTGFPKGSGGFLCAAEAADLVDGPHFEGTPYEIPADGQALKTPYIAFQDPTFGGMLYVDPKKLGLTGYPTEPQWQEADQVSVNVALARILSGILSFVGK